MPHDAAFHLGMHTVCQRTRLGVSSIPRVKAYILSAVVIGGCSLFFKVYLIVPKGSLTPRKSICISAEFFWSWNKGII